MLSVVRMVWPLPCTTWFESYGSMAMAVGQLPVFVSVPAPNVTHGERLTLRTAPTVLIEYHVLP
jgi:hypothetical protein